MALTPEDQKTKRQLPTLLGARKAFRPRGIDILPHHGATASPQEQPPGMGKSGTLRAAIFGINDGLVTNTSLIMGFAGASQSRGVIILAGISGLLAGAFSMAAGEYISMSVQRELLERLLHLEAHEIAADPQGEEQELVEIYEAKGLSPELAKQMASEVMAIPKVALDTHAREELGIDPDEGLGSPWGASASSFLTFSVGAILPLLPFFLTEGDSAVIAAGILAAVVLLVVGGLTSLLTGRRPIVAALRMLAIGSAAALVTYGIGVVIGG